MYFTSKISYTSEAENGEFITISEEYLVKDESFAGVEAAVYAHCEENGIGDFKLESVAKKKVNNLIFLDEFPYFEFKVIMISENEKTGKEKRITDVCIVGAKDFEQAFERVKADYTKCLIPWTIEAGKITKLTSYVETEQEEIEEEEAEGEEIVPLLPIFEGALMQEETKSRREETNYSGLKREESQRMTIIREDIDIASGRRVTTYSQDIPEVETTKEYAK